MITVITDRDDIRYLLEETEKRCRIGTTIINADGWEKLISTVLEDIYETVQSLMDYCEEEV